MKKMWLGFQSISGIAPALCGGVMAMFATLLVTASAMAQEAEEAAAGSADVGKWAALAAGLAIGIAAAGCGLGQGRAGAAALDGIARNPNASDKLFTPMILVLALIESLAIYALVIAIMLIGKVP
jgi:F-type H+-transporting ATPase subunit c